MIKYRLECKNNCMHLLRKIHSIHAVDNFEFTIIRVSSLSLQWLVLFLACDFSRRKICTPFFFRSIVVKLYFWIGNFQENFLLSNRTILLAKWCRSNVQFKCMTRNVHLFFFGFLLSCKSSKKIPSEREREPGDSFQF